MAGHGVDQLLRIAALLEQLERLARMAGLEVRVALVVEVVQQPGDRVELLVLAPLARIGAHSGLDAQQVLSQRVALDPFLHQLPGLFTRGRHARQVIHTRTRTCKHMSFVTLATSRMEKFIIEGGTPLSGTVVPAGNKNAALPALAATLLTSDEVVLRNTPRIRDVQAMVELLVRLGAKAEWREENTIAVQCDEITHTAVDPGWAERIRASFLLAGPLLARFGAAAMPPPGGDVIGRRRLDPHLDAFRARGAEVRAGRTYELRAPDGLHACDFFMDEPSVMATENALMAAALTPGSTVIHNAASEPHVQDLARILLQMGAGVEGIGSNVLIVHGREELGGADYTIGPDYIEVGSFIALAAVTGGELRIRDTVPDDLRMTRLAFERLGCRMEFEGDDVVVPPGQGLCIRDDAGNATSKIEDGPWPAFPADLT